MSRGKVLAKPIHEFARTRHATPYMLYSARSCETDEKLGRCSI